MPARKAVTPVPSVSHAVAILQLLGRSTQPMGVTGIARALGLSPSSTFNLARTLVAEDLVDFDPVTKGYRIGVGSIQFARMALRGDAVVMAARPVMDQLAEQLDAAVAVWRAGDDGRLTLLALAESEAATRIHMAVGQRQPAGAGATGRALLASQNVREQALRTAFTAIRWPGRIDADQYVEQVQTARQTGYALDLQWLNLGIETVAAAIGDAAGRVRYCLSASMFAGRHDEAQWAAIGTMMVAAATAIRRKEEGRE